MDALGGFHPAVRTWFERRFPDGPDRPAGARLAGDRRRRRHADRRADRLGQDAGRVPGLHRPAVPRAPRPTPGAERRRPRWSTSRRSRRWPSTSSRTSSAPLAEIARGRARARAARARRSASSCARGDTAADRARRDAQAAAAHPGHHARVALPAAHRRAEPRAAARRAHRDRRRDPRARARQARLAPGALARAARARRASSRPQRIGLSATQRPIETIARLLVGAGAGREHAGRRAGVRDRRRRPPPRARPGDRAAATASSRRSPRTSSGARSTTGSPAHVRAHRTTLVFVNTRRLAERSRTCSASGSARSAGGRAPRQPVARSAGCGVEERLRAGELRALVATARSSSASTSARSTWSARSARRAASPRSCSASAAPATPAARRRRGGSSRSRATSWSSARRCCAACAAGRLDALVPPGRAARHPGPADRGRVRGRGLGRGRALRRWSAARRRTRTSPRADFDAVVELLSRGHRRPGAAGAPRTCTATG